mmetsp:Transcript_84833/g.236166  ORF Transcript_84833/g.236166 Transcript_84833/m.236166 type:complete len:163 (+) Transcript_84833:36-524(+)
MALEDLTPVIDTARTYCLNEESKEGHRSVFSEGTSWTLRSDCDEQMILYVPFTGTVKLKQLELTAPAGDHAPTRAKLFINRKALGFEDVDSVKPTQEIDLEASDKGEPLLIKLDYVNFQRVTSVHIHFENDREPDDEKTEISRLRFFGTSTKRVDVSELKKC